MFRGVLRVPFKPPMRNADRRTGDQSQVSFPHSLIPYRVPAKWKTDEHNDHSPHPALSIRFSTPQPLEQDELSTSSWEVPWINGCTCHMAMGQNPG